MHSIHPRYILLWNLVCRLDRHHTIMICYYVGACTRAAITIARLYFLVIPHTFISTKQCLLSDWSVSFLCSTTTRLRAGFPWAPLTPRTINWKFRGPIIFLFCRWHGALNFLPGQPLLLQDCVSWLSPVHSLPPNNATWSILLCLSCVPPPQVTEHVSHELQCTHVQFTVDFTFID